MELKIKKLSENAVIPSYAHEGDAGLDLTCTNITTELNECGQLILVYHTDIAVEIPNGYVGFLVPRSSIARKSLALTNSIGTIDAGYRGEIMAKMKATTDVVPAIYKQSDKFAQLVIVPYMHCDIVEAEELTPSDRGENGYGSTDNKKEEDISAVTGSNETANDADNTNVKRKRRSRKTATNPAAEQENGSEQAK